MTITPGNTTLYPNTTETTENDPKISFSMSVKFKFIVYTIAVRRLKRTAVAQITDRQTVHLLLVTTLAYRKGREILNHLSAAKSTAFRKYPMKAREIIQVIVKINGYVNVLMAVKKMTDGGPADPMMTIETARLAKKQLEAV